MHVTFFTLTCKPCETLAGGQVYYSATYTVLPDGFYSISGRYRRCLEIREYVLILMVLTGSTTGRSKLVLIPYVIHREKTD